MKVNPRQTTFLVIALAVVTFLIYWWRQKQMSQNSAGQSRFTTKGTTSGLSPTTTTASVVQPLGANPPMQPAATAMPLTPGSMSIPSGVTNEILSGQIQDPLGSQPDFLTSADETLLSADKLFGNDLIDPAAIIPAIDPADKALVPNVTGNFVNNLQMGINTAKKRNEGDDIRGRLANPIDFTTSAFNLPSTIEPPTAGICQNFLSQNAVMPSVGKGAADFLGY